MGSVNKVILLGRLGADPEVRYTQDQTPVASFNLATSINYKIIKKFNKIKKRWGW